MNTILCNPSNVRPRRRAAAVLAGAALLLAVLLGAHSARGAGIHETRHNLSASGSGEIKAGEQNQVCIFCHTPHHSNDVEPLWSRSLGSNYVPYDSTTLKARTGQPSGASRLCLSCHDGTIALGTLQSNYQVASLGALGSERPSNLDIHLMDDHPISIAYSAELASGNQLHPPATLPATIKLQEGRLECTACHNPHQNPYGKFLVEANIDSALCVICHAKTGWSASAHRAGQVFCESCHQPHNSGTHPRLLTSGSEEAACLTACHNGTADAGSNIAAAFAKTYRHPLDAASGVHDPAESPLTMDDHVECVDCHNPHQANSAAADPPEAVGPIQGVRGVDSWGNVTDPSTLQYREYELCFKCHADHAFGTAASRQIEEPNQRLRFAATNPSFHPVVNKLAASIDVPNLRSQYVTSNGTVRTFVFGDEQIYCSDCHAPHGADEAYRLDARNDRGYRSGYTEEGYQLCFRCHDPDLLFASDTHFEHSTFGTNLHTRHVQTEEVACSVCHDPHGVSGGASHRHLINFDTTAFDSDGALYDPDDGAGPSCTVSCHPGKKSY